MLPLCSQIRGSHSLPDASPQVTPGLSFPPCSKLASAPSPPNLFFLLRYVPSQCGFCPLIFVSSSCPPGMMHPQPRAPPGSSLFSLWGPCPGLLRKLPDSASTSDLLCCPGGDGLTVSAHPLLGSKSPSCWLLQSNYPTTNVYGVQHDVSPKMAGAFGVHHWMPAPTTGSGPQQLHQNHPPLSEWIPAMRYTTAGSCNGPRKTPVLTNSLSCLKPLWQPPPPSFSALVPSLFESQLHFQTYLHFFKKIAF